jgi:hypothetical protein
LNLQKAITDLEEIRQSFFNVAENSWQECFNQLFVSPKLLEEISCVSKQLAFTARRVVDELYPYCGMRAANPDTEINMVWRNLHTASQHSVFTRSLNLS